MKLTLLVLLLPVLVLSYPYPQRSSEVTPRLSRGKQKFKIEEIPVSASDDDTLSRSRNSDIRRRSGHESQREPDTASSVVSPVTQQLISSRGSAFRRGIVSSTQSSVDTFRSRSNFNRRGPNLQDNEDRSFPSRRRESVTETTESPFKVSQFEEVNQESSNENYPAPSTDSLRNVPTIEASSTPSSVLLLQTPTPSSANRRRTSSSRNSDLASRTSFSALDTFPTRQTRFESSKRRNSPEVVLDASGTGTEGRRNERRNFARGSVKANPVNLNVNSATSIQDIPSRSRSSARRDSVVTRSGRGEKTIVPTTSSIFTARSRLPGTQPRSGKENEGISNAIPVQESHEDPTQMASKRMDIVSDTSEEPLVSDHVESTSNETELSTTTTEENVPSSSEFPSSSESSINTPKPAESLQNTRRKSAGTRYQPSLKDLTTTERAFRSRSQSNTPITGVGTSSRRGVSRTKVNDNSADHSTNTSYDESVSANFVSYRREKKISSGNIEQPAQRPLSNSRRNSFNIRGLSDGNISSPSLRSSSRRDSETPKGGIDVSTDTSAVSAFSPRNTNIRRASTADASRGVHANERKTLRGTTAEGTEPHGDEISSRRGSRARSNETSRANTNSFESGRPVARSGRKIPEADVTSAAPRTSRKTSVDEGQRSNLKANSASGNTSKHKKENSEDEDIDETENYPAGFLKALKALKSTKNGKPSTTSEENNKLSNSLKRSSHRGLDRGNDTPSTSKERTRKVSLLLAPSPPSDSAEQDLKPPTNNIIIPQNQEKSKNSAQNKSKAPGFSPSNRVSFRPKSTAKPEPSSQDDDIKSAKSHQAEISVLRGRDSSSISVRKTTSRISSISHRDLKPDSATVTGSALLPESVSTIDSEFQTDGDISSLKSRPGSFSRARSYKSLTTPPASDSSTKSTYSSRTRTTTSRSPLSRANIGAKQSLSTTTPESILDVTVQSALIQSPVAAPNPHRFSARYRNDLLRVTGALRVTSTPVYVPTVPTVRTTTSTTTTALPDSSDVEISSEALTLDASSLTIDKGSSTLTDVSSDTSLHSQELAQSMKESNEIFTTSSTEIEQQMLTDFMDNLNHSITKNTAITVPLPETDNIVTTTEPSVTTFLSNSPESRLTNSYQTTIVSSTINPATTTVPSSSPLTRKTTKRPTITTTSTLKPISVKVPKTTTKAPIERFIGLLENIVREVWNSTTMRPTTTSTKSAYTSVIKTTPKSMLSTTTTSMPFSSTTTSTVATTNKRLSAVETSSITTTQQTTTTIETKLMSTSAKSSISATTVRSTSPDLKTASAMKPTTVALTNNIFNVSSILTVANETDNDIFDQNFLVNKLFAEDNKETSNKVKETSEKTAASTETPSPTKYPSTTPSSGRFSTRLTVAPRGSIPMTSTLPPPPQFSQSLNFGVLNTNEASIYNPPPPVQYIFTQPPSTRRTPAPYVIFGIFPNNTIFRKLPNSDVREIVSENEISQPQPYYPDDYRTTSESTTQETKKYTDLDNSHRTNQDVQNTALYNLHHVAENEVLRTNAATYTGSDVSAQPSVSEYSTTVTIPTTSVLPVTQAAPAVVQVPVELTNSVYNGQDNKYKNFWSSTTTKKPQFRVLTTDIPVSTTTSPSSTSVFIVTPETPTTESSTTEVFRWKPVASSPNPQDTITRQENIQGSSSTSTVRSTTSKAISTTAQTPVPGQRGLISRVLGNLPASSTKRSTSEAAAYSSTTPASNSAFNGSNISNAQPITVTNPTTVSEPITTTSKPTVTTTKPAMTTTAKPTTKTTKTATTKKPSVTTKPTQKSSTTKPTTTPKPNVTTKPTTTTKSTTPTTTKGTTTTKPTTTTSKATTTTKPTTTTTTKATTTTTSKPTTTTTKATTTTTSKPTTTTTKATTTTTTSKPTTTTTKATTTATRKPTTTTTTRKPTTKTTTTTTTKKPTTTIKSTTTKPTTTTAVPTTTTAQSMIIATPETSSDTTFVKNGLVEKSFGDLSFINQLFREQQDTKKRPGRERTEELASKVIEVALQRASASSTTTAHPTLNNKDSQLKLPETMDQLEQKSRPSRDEDVAMASKVIEAALQRPSSSTAAPSSLDNKKASLSPDEQFLAALLGSQSTKSTALPTPTKTTVAPKLSPDEQFLAALLQSQVKAAVTTKPKPQTTAPKKLTPDEQFLAALLQSQLGGSTTPKPKSQVAGVRLTDDQLLAALLSGAQAGRASQSKTTTAATAAKPPAGFGGLFGQLGGGNTLSDVEVESDDGDPPRGQRLVKAAIDVTKAVSQFMNVVIQGASERFQTFFRSGTSLLSNYFSWGSSQPGGFS